MKVIYADVLFVINLAVDYILLFASARLSGIKFERLRGLLSALIGAFYSFSIIFPLGKIFLVISRLSVSALMIFVTFGKRKIADYIRILAIFYITGFLFSGITELINNITGSRLFLNENGTFYFEMTAFEIVACSVVSFLVVEIFRRFFYKKSEDNCLVRIYFGGKSVILNGFADTGNKLTEPLSGSPVVICKPEDFLDIMPKELISAIDEKMPSAKYRIRLIPCETVTGMVLISAIKAEKIIAYSDGEELTSEDVYIGFSDFAIEKNVILNNNIVYKNDNKIISEVGLR